MIAEGIETEMLDFVRDPGATHSARPGAQAAQGYLLGRPGVMPSGKRPEVIAPPDPPDPKVRTLKTASGAPGVAAR